MSATIFNLDNSQENEYQYNTRPDWLGYPITGSINIANPGWNAFHYFNYHQRQILGDEYYGPEMVHCWRQMSDSSRSPYVEMAQNQEPIWTLPNWAKPNPGWNQWHYFNAQRHGELGENYNVQQIREEWQNLSHDDWQWYVNLAEQNRCKYQKSSGKSRAPTAYEIFSKRLSYLGFQPTFNPDMCWSTFASELRNWMVQDFARQNNFEQASWEYKTKEWNNWWLSRRPAEQIWNLMWSYGQSGL